MFDYPDPRDTDELSPEERAQMEAAYDAMDRDDDRRPRPEDFGLPPGTPDPFA